MKQFVIAVLVAIFMITITPVVLLANELPKIDCREYSPAQFSYQESFESLEGKLILLDNASAGKVLDEFIECFMSQVSRSGDFVNNNRGGSWGFLQGGRNLGSLFPFDFSNGVRLRRVNKDLFAVWIMRNRDFIHGSGIHILKRDSSDISTVGWHPEIDSLVTARYAAIKALPLGVSKSGVEDNLASMRAVDLYARYQAGDSAAVSAILTEQFDLDEAPDLSDAFDGPKSYHKVEEYFMDNRMFTSIYELQINPSEVNGWFAFRVGQSRDIHFLYLGFTESPPEVSEQ